MKSGHKTFLVSMALALLSLSGCAKTRDHADEKANPTSSPSRRGVQQLTGLKWKLKVAGEVTSSPVFYDGFIYVATKSGLVAFESVSGQEMWKFKVKGGVESSPIPVDGSVYLSGGDDHLYALEAKTGAQRWKFKTKCPSGSPPAAADGVVYSGSNDGYLYAIDAVTGAEKWKVEGEDKLFVSGARAPVIFPMPAGDSVCYWNLERNNLFAVDLKTKQRKWKYRLVELIIMGNRGAVFGEGKAYVKSDKFLHAIDAESGQEKWRFQIGGFARPTFAEGTVYVSTSGGYLCAIDSETGQKKWQANVDGGLFPSSASVIDGVAYIAGSAYEPEKAGLPAGDMPEMRDGYVVAVDAKTGEQKWKHKVDTLVGGELSPCVSESMVFFVTRENVLHALY